MRVFIHSAQSGRYKYFMRLPRRLLATFGPTTDAQKDLPRLRSGAAPTDLRSAVCAARDRRPLRRLGRRGLSGFHRTAVAAASFSASVDMGCAYTHSHTQTDSLRSGVPIFFVRTYETDFCAAYKNNHKLCFSRGCYIP